MRIGECPRRPSQETDSFIHERHCAPVLPERFFEVPSLVEWWQRGGLFPRKQSMSDALP